MARERPWFWFWLLAALLAGSLLRLAFILHHPVFTGDALVYGGIARNLLLHGIYGFNEQVSDSGSVTILPTLIRLPGYPLFLAACFRLFGVGNFIPVLYLQLAADLTTCALTAAVARRLFGRRAGLVALWIGALCPFTANYVATPITESLVLTTIALTFYAMTRWQAGGGGYNFWLWVLAAALSASVLLRPEQGLLAVAVLPSVVWIEQKRRHAERRGWTAAAGPALAVALCLAVPLLPWTLRNWRTFHVFQPLAPRSATDAGESPPTGFNSWYRTWGIEFASTDLVYWNVNGAPIEPAALPNRAFALSCAAPANARREELPLYAETVALLQEYNEVTTDTPEMDARFAELAGRRSRAAPLCTAMGMPAARLLNMLLRPRSELLRVPDEWWKAPTPLRLRAFALGYAVLGDAYLFLALAGLAAWARFSRKHPDTKPLLYAMSAMVLLRAALLLTLDNSEPRYTLEFFPVFFVWIAALFARHSESRDVKSSSQSVGSAAQDLLRQKG